MPFYDSNSFHDYGMQGDYAGYNNNMIQADQILIGGALMIMPNPYDLNLISSTDFSAEIRSGFYADTHGIPTNIEDQA